MSKKFDFGKVAFVLALCLASFGAGIATTELKTFPYSLLKEARSSAKALSSAQQPANEWDLAADTEEKLDKPTVRRHSGNAGSELILVSGGDGYLKAYSPENGVMAYVLDREGSVRHVWHKPKDLWDDLREVTRGPVQRTIKCYGLHVYPNGDLLISFQGGASWPYGIGMARFDKDSKLIWKKELHTHHWFSIGDDGRIYSPAQYAIEAPYRLGERFVTLPGKDKKLLADVIRVIDPDNGAVLEEISMLDALVRSDRVGLISSEENWDPLHLNTANVVTKAMEQQHPLLKTGDLVVSFKELSTIGVLDRETKRFKWIAAGTTVKQHSPRIFDGGVLSFDNQGGDEKTGGSRLTWMDLSSGESKTLFPRPDVPLPGPFLTRVQGRIDISSDQRRVLVTLSDMGAVWEVDLSTGEVPWEYLYAHPDRPGRRRCIQTAEYLRDASFSMNPPKPAP